MKVLFLCNLNPDKAGAFERFTGALGTALRAESGTLCAGFASAPAGAARVLLDAGGVITHVLPGWTAGDGRVRAWAMVRPAFRLVRQTQPDVVALHFGNELPALLLMVLCRLCGPRRTAWVWHQRQQMQPARGVLRQWTSRIRLLALACDRFVTLYDEGAEVLRRRGIPAASIQVIRNGVPASPSVPVSERAAIRASFGVADDVPLVVNISSLTPRKRVALSLEAFAQAVTVLRAQAHPGHLARLVLIGEGPEEAGLRAVAAQTGLADAVQFAGRRDDVRRILSGADILLLSSEAEACPWAVLEAMSAGVPAIVTAAGAARELVEQGVSGYVVPCGNTAAMTGRLAELLADPGLRRQQGQAALHRWKTQFTEALAVRRHLDLYTGLCGGREA